MDLRVSISLIIFAGACALVASQSAPNVPITISTCYKNATAYNRFNRQPMHIENLIAIIRKIEDKTNQEWTMRRLTRNILKEFQFDGLSYDPYRREGFQFETDELEDHRTAIVLSTLAGQEKIPEGVLDNDEKCALHWMLSHSINATLRDDEVSRLPNLRAKRATQNDSHGNNNNNDENEDVDTFDFIINSDEDDDDEATKSGKGRTKSPKFGKITTTKVVLPPINEDADVIDNIASDYQGDQERYEPGTKFERQSEIPRTKQPLETGIVYTKWGSISAGRLIAGIAAGLEPVTTPVVVTSESAFRGIAPSPSNNNGGNNGNNWGNGANGGNQFRSGSSGAGRWKRQASGGNDYLQPLYNIYAATLAGDVGQAAILNAVYTKPTSESPPTGYFNDTICPREYIMDSLTDPKADVSHEHDTWTHMTSAEIRGGVDGLVLGLQIREWDNRHPGLRLSQILEMYYGPQEKGIVDDPRYRACNRGSLYTNLVNPTEIHEQSKSFAYVYNNRTSKLKVATTENINEIYNLVQQAYTKMSGHVSTLQSLDGSCKRRETTGTEVPESDKYVPPRATVYAVLDHTDTEAGIVQQKRFVAQLAYELDVSPFGSRLGLVNGATGQILIKPNFTDNAAVLACRILSERTPVQSTSGLVSVLTNLDTEIKKVRDEEARFNFTDHNGIAILVLNQGKKFDEGQRSEVRSKLYEFEKTLGDVHVIYATSKYQLSDYDDYVVDNEFDVIRIQSSANLSSEASKFTQEFVKRQHARITYARCNKNEFDQSEEHKLGTDLFISPNTIQYYKISPDYFYSAKKLQLRFSSDNGKVRVCVSRSDRFPNSQNTGSGTSVDCYETSGVYQGIGSSTADLEIGYKKPCGGDGKRSGCKPIYLSITPISFPTAGSVGFDCSVDKCRYSDQVKVTFSHWDMRCNSAVNTLVSIPGLFVALLLSLVAFTRSS